MSAIWQIVKDMLAGQYRAIADCGGIFDDLDGFCYRTDDKPVSLGLLYLAADMKLQLSGFLSRHLDFQSKKLSL